MTRPDIDLETLARMGKEAAPASPTTSHVGAAELARMRTDDESADLDDAYRHMASCAACRARMIEPVATPEKTRSRVDGLRVRRPLFVGLAAAASIALALGARALVGSDRPLVVHQESYAGMMGTTDDTVNVATSEARDRDIKLSLTAPSSQSAALVTADAEGHTIAPVYWFTRGRETQLELVIAPRTFAPHVGAAYGFVLVDDTARLRAWGEETSVLEAPSLDVYESALRDHAPGIRIARIVIGETDEPKR